MRKDFSAFKHLISNQQLLNAEIILALNPQQQQNFFKDQAAFVKLSFALSQLAEADQTRLEQNFQKKAALGRKIARLKYFDSHSRRWNAWRIAAGVLFIVIIALSLVLPAIGIPLVVSTVLMWVFTGLTCGILATVIALRGADYLRAGYRAQERQLNTELNDLKAAVAVSLGFLLDEYHQDPQAPCFIEVTPDEYREMEALKYSVYADERAHNRFDVSWLSVTSGDPFKVWLTGTTPVVLGLPKRVVYRNERGAEALLTKNEFLAGRKTSADFNLNRYVELRAQPLVPERPHYRFYGNQYQVARMQALKDGIAPNADLNHVSLQLAAARAQFRPR